MKSLTKLKFNPKVQSNQKKNAFLCILDEEAEVNHVNFGLEFDSGDEKETKVEENKQEEKEEE